MLEDMGGIDLADRMIGEGNPLYEIPVQIAVIIGIQRQPTGWAFDLPSALDVQTDEIFFVCYLEDTGKCLITALRQLLSMCNAAY